MAKKNALLDKILNATTLNDTSSLTNSKFYGKKDMITTTVPMINVALSGVVDGGFVPGSTVIAGPTKHFKTGFALLLAASFLKKYPEGIIIFYDSEFGTPQSYFKSFGIPTDSVVHVPISTVEELRHDIAVQLDGIERNDKVLIIVDSLGNLASNKELQDAIDGKDVADMTRAKMVKSLFRTIGPKLVIKDVPLVVINHTYKTLEMYSTDVVSGGTGVSYNADTIWILGRQADKEEVDKKKVLQGYNFIINVSKSRYVREGSKIPISISFEGGINRYSGLLAVAVESGIIQQPTKGKYALVDIKTEQFVEPHYKEDDIIDNKEFWDKMLKNKLFTDYLTKKYQLPTASIME
jgi:RecA/RadA recombinase